MTETIKLLCTDCGNEFRWLPNSTIKPIRCNRCQNLLDFQKKKDSAALIAKNKILLSGASMYGKNKRTEPKLVVSTGKEKKSVKSFKKLGCFDKTKMKSKKAYMALADSMFSRYIRLKHSIETGGNIICKCYTCGIIKSIKNVDCGHWQRRGFKTTRYNENNARPQCKKCNMFRSGEPEKFEINLIKEIGQINVDILKELSQQTGEDNILFYNEMAGLFKYKYEKLCKEKGIKNPWK